jgi:DNA-binding XRE family transcriptional regulator
VKAKRTGMPTNPARHHCYLMFFTSFSLSGASFIIVEVEGRMITSFQMKAARALLGIDQRTLAEMSGLSLPTIQRMEGSLGTVRGVVESLTKVVDALGRAGVELIGEHARSEDGGRGVRLKRPAPPRRR